MTNEEEMAKNAETFKAWKKRYKSPLTEFMSQIREGKIEIEMTEETKTSLALTTNELFGGDK
jgi:hypothetical protein